MNVNTKRNVSDDNATEKELEKEYMEEMSAIAERESENTFEEGEEHDLLAGYEDENGTILPEESTCKT